jgi:hypothetical protein
VPTIPAIFVWPTQHGGGCDDPTTESKIKPIHKPNRNEKECDELSWCCDTAVRTSNSRSDAPALVGYSIVVVIVIDTHTHTHTQPDLQQDVEVVPGLICDLLSTTWPGCSCVCSCDFGA